MSRHKNSGVVLNSRLLKKLRNEKRLSQESLAYECMDNHQPVSISSIKRAELGKRVSYRTVHNIATYFKVSPDELIYSEKHPVDDVLSEILDELKKSNKEIYDASILEEGLPDYLESFATGICWKKALRLSGSRERTAFNFLCQAIIKTYIFTSDEEIKKAFLHQSKDCKQ